MSEEEIPFDLKGTKTLTEDMQRDDLIFIKGNIWNCVSKNMSLYQNM